MKFSIPHSPTPSTLGYRMPAEWEPHAATWLSWPRAEGISFPGCFDSIPHLWAKMVECLVSGEEVHINVFNKEHAEAIIQTLKEQGLEALIEKRIFLHDFPAYEPWCRDHGPLFIQGPRGLAVTDWIYNAWGGKYPPFDRDNEVPSRIASWLGIPSFSLPIVLEGGSIEVNGEGTLLTTEACLLHPNRNSHLTRDQIEAYLKAYLGIKKVLWLGEGIMGDDTDGHIDDLTRFVDPTTVVTCIEEDPMDENYDVLQENWHRLEFMTTAKQEPLRILTLPLPRKIEREGLRLPASYANFYIGNSVVLLPTYGDLHRDQQAQDLLQTCFPTRRVIGIDATELIWGLGAFHCVTQQQPQSLF